MSWRDHLPMEESRTVKTRLDELEKQAGTLPKIFSFLIAAWVVAISEQIPLPFIPSSQRILTVAILIGVVYVYRDERKRAQDRAKQKAKDLTDNKQSKLKEYKDGT